MGVMKEEDFLKKASFYCRYLAQFVTEGDVPKILETIKDLDNLRQQAEKEKVE